MTGDRITCLTMSDATDPKALFVGRESGLIHRLRRADPAAPPMVVFKGHTAAVTALCPAAGAEELYSASLDGTVRLWTTPTEPAPETPTSPPMRRLLKSFNVGTPLRSVAAATGGDGGVYAGTMEGDVVAIAASGAVTTYERFHTSAVSALLQLDMGVLLSGSLDGRIVGWDTQAQQPAWIWAGHTGPVLGLSVSGTNVISVGADKAMCVWPIPADTSAPPGATPHGPQPTEGEEGDASGPYANAPASVVAVTGEEEDGEEGGQGAAGGIVGPWEAKPTARVELPWQPNAVSTAFGATYALLACSNERVAVVDMRRLNTLVAKFAAANEAAVDAAIAAIERQTAKRRAVLERRGRYRVKQLRAEIAATAGGDATGAPSHRGGQRDDNGDDDQDEEGEGAGYDEEGAAGGAAGLTEEQAARLEDGTAEIQAAIQEAIQTFEKRQHTATTAAQQLRYQTWSMPASSFMAHPMCDVLPGACGHAVVGVGADGAVVLAAAGDSVHQLELRPGVRAA